MIDILISLTILLLSSAAAVLNGVYVYSTLSEISPGEANLGEALAIEGDYYTRYLSPATLLGDIGFRVADGVMVSYHPFCLST